MNFSPATIRNISFAMAVDGYHPEQVDKTLDVIASQLGERARVDADLLTVSFETVPTGYDADQVKAVFAEMRRVLPAVACEPAKDLLDADAADEHLAAEAETEQAGRREPDAAPMEPLPEVDSDVLEGERDAAGVGAEESPVRLVRAAVEFEQASAETLPAAVERTKMAVSELEAFVAAQMEQTKAALASQIDATQSDCTHTLETARTISDSTLTETRQRATTVLEQATHSADELRIQFTAHLSDLQAGFDEELADQVDTIRQHLERLIAEATELNCELHDHVSGVHRHVATSLRDARRVLVPHTDQMAA